MSQIHQTAIIDPKARIGSNVSIGPFCVVGPNVTLGDNVVLKSHVVLDGHTTIGENTMIYPFASIGQETPDLKYKGEPSKLIIGKNNKIREYVTMNPGTEAGGMLTQVGDNCLFMPNTHVAHDCILGDRVIMANSAALGGHVQVGNNVVIGGLAAVHQFVRIGSFAVIGGMSGVESDVIPYGRVKGERAHLAGLNLIGLERGGFEKDTVKTLQKATKQLFDGDGTLDERIKNMSDEYANDSAVMQMIEFAKTRERFGLCGFPTSKAA
ncbi:MAG: acyl-[acyl-carrier-protein]--UDP-N-acetylglucosamine O-acyltransferase [Micavibrio aeruginosavorus]|uniref:Acyl-[acyl-carrier-protein]--UDP-N-acetylglucosamine O-acyltransferase n=1 Tax=Micavibrio aeruginosavorus TaxID=349221 RepID=A0A2W5PRD6_9BACT|nr:MAG: acyl-[acyl-carrier-protein]--UDP-N-acetylglucosamine O-acyltransferase [Micavibrio aeruginosavorus]